MKREALANPFWGGAAITALAVFGAWANTDLNAPPRYDGAGYAVLAESLASGRGYREIDHPDAPRHGHFPPGYPLTLAALWRATGGRSVSAAHGLSMVCTAAATLAVWRWFRTLYRPGVACLLGLALAVNWTWGRNGGSIQSEPLFLLLEALAWLAAVRADRRGGVAAGLILGVLLAACALTRQVGAALAAALVLNLIVRARRTAALASAVTAGVLVVPWVVWLAAVRAPGQAGLFTADNLPGQVASQAVFYLQRTPDQWIGPVVEIGTVFPHRPIVWTLVNAWAALAAGLIALGLVRTLRTSRRRAAGLSALLTLALLLVWPFTEAGRFLIPLVPCLLVGAVEGLSAVGDWMTRRWPCRRTVSCRGLAASLVLALSLPYPLYALAAGRSEAQRKTNAVFDAACSFLSTEATRPGPVVTRHPGEVYWQTGRLAVAPDDDLARAIERWGAAYLLDDEERYAGAPASPIVEYVRRHPGRTREVWALDDGRSSARVYEVVNEPDPGTGAGRNPRSGESSADGAGPSS